MASIKMYPAGSRRPGGGNTVQSTPGGVTIPYIKLVSCLTWAYNYGVKEWLISGPDWIYSERYDIDAKATGPVPQAQLKLMVQTLLADRFKLTLHHETKNPGLCAGRGKERTRQSRLHLAR